MLVVCQCTSCFRACTRAEGHERPNSRSKHPARCRFPKPAMSGYIASSVPRDTAGSFEPRLVKKRQRRLTGVDEMVLSLSAKGLTHGEIAAHLAEVYGAEVSRQTVSSITKTVMEGMAEW